MKKISDKTNILISRSFLLFTLLFIIIVFIFNKYLLAPAFFQFHWVVMIIGFSSWTRTLSLKAFTGFYLLGATILPIITLLFFVVNSREWIDFGVPFIEEIIKILPLLIVFSLKNSRLRRAASLTDYLLIGAALGGGFQLIEDMMFKLKWDKMLDLLYGPNIGVFHLFPSSTIQTGSAARDGFIVFSGHGTSTALIAMGIGIAYQLYKRKKIILAWIVPVSIFLFITLSHVLFNMTSVGSLDGFWKILHWIIGAKGLMIPWILWICFAIVVFWDYKILKRFFDKYKITKIKFTKLRLWKQSFGKKRNRFLLVYFGLLRRIRILAYAEENNYIRSNTEISLKLWKSMLEYPEDTD